MKKLIPIVILVLSIQEIFACCIGGEISIAPRGNEMSQNPILLIDFMERDYKIYNKLKEATFYMIDDQGNKFDLEILDSNKGIRILAQIILKPKEKLRKGSKVSLIIDEMQAQGENQKRFIQMIQSKKWVVKFEEDRVAPEFNKELTYEYVNNLNTSAPGHGVLVKVDFWDNNEYKYEINSRIENPIVIEAISDEGNRYLFTTNRDSFWIYHGMCGATFKLKRGTEYSFKIRLIDLSGNKSLETKEIKFTAVD